MILIGFGCKLNMDGSAKGNPGQTGIGGGVWSEIIEDIGRKQKYYGRK